MANYFNNVHSYRNNDPSLWALVATNAIVIFIAVWQQWELAPLLLVYFAQNIVLGFFTFLRIRSLKNFSTEGLKINNRPAYPTHATKIFLSGFFLMHYGGFHFAYAVFLISNFGASFAGITLFFAMLSVVLFFINHTFSFYYNLKRDTRGTPNVGKIFVIPYLRIFPMHIILVSGAAVLSGGEATVWLIIFLVLKTVADAGSHKLEHRMYASESKTQIDKIHHA